MQSYVQSTVTMDMCQINQKSTNHGTRQSNNQVITVSWLQTLGSGRSSMHEHEHHHGDLATFGMTGQTLHIAHV